MVDSYRGLSLGTGGGYYHIVFFNCAFVFSSLMYSISLFKLLEHDSCCVFLCLLFLFFVSSPLKLVIILSFPWKRESVFI